MSKNETKKVSITCPFQNIINKIELTHGNTSSKRS